MKGPRHLITPIGRAKKDLHVLRCPVFTENIGVVKSQKMVYQCTSSDVLFSTESIGEEKKKSTLFGMRPPFSPRPYDSACLAYTYVNPALCLQPIFSLSTCDILCTNYVGFRLTILASSFCSPHPTNKFFKKTSLDLSFYLGFNFDGRPIKF